MSLEPPPPPPVAAATCWTKAIYVRADSRVNRGRRRCSRRDGRARETTGTGGVRWLLMQSPPLKYYSAAFSHTPAHKKTHTHNPRRVYNMYSVLTVVARRRRRRVTPLLCVAQTRTHIHPLVPGATSFVQGSTVVSAAAAAVGG